MSEKILVSIIVPVYNGEKYIESCINSILKQSEEKFELIIVDDGSTDNTYSIANKYSQIDKRVLILTKTNGGVSEARNYALDRANGKYIVFVDSDDLVENNYISSLLKYVIEENADLVCTGYKMLKSYNRSQNISYSKMILLQGELVDNFIWFFKNISNAPWGKIYKTEILNKYNIRFPMNIPYGEDTIFNIKYFSYINSVVLSEDITYQYNCCNQNSAMKKYFPQMFEYIWEVYKTKKEFFYVKKEEDYYGLICNSEESYYFECCAQHYITNVKNKEEIQRKLMEIKGKFPKAEADVQWSYSEYVKNNNWKKFVLKWKQKNVRKYLRIMIIKNIL